MSAAPLSRATLAAAPAAEATELEAPIIDAPRKQHPLRRALFLALTVIAWVVWISLFAPLSELIDSTPVLRWTAGYFARSHVTFSPHAMATVWIVVGFGVAAMSFFAVYDVLVRPRRATDPIAAPPEPEAMANVLGAPERFARDLRNARRAIIWFSADGRMTEDGPAEPEQGASRKTA
jgi:biofilm PGA synthesis protein PgaD